jgi:hypothetical protein
MWVSLVGGMFSTDSKEDGHGLVKKLSAYASMIRARQDRIPNQFATEQKQICRR